VTDGKGGYLASRSDAGTTQGGGTDANGKSRGVPVAGERHPCPPASIEFEVADVASAAAELTAKGYRLIHGARTEPSAQITARLLSPEGLLVAVCYSLAFRDS
jgi:hypothetical protein